MKRSICIHGHFYQPPRENPWLESIELQDSAYPYHDWNARITAECYGPNATSRILGSEGWIDQIVNNYARISFDFGPTLLAWMEPHAPEVYRAILEADRESMARFGGHGSAIAQAYGHLILPLANARDQRTQVRWGIRDFERRFGRRPEGMWLPETAVDLASLEALAAEGIAFTILAPHQARRVRAAKGTKWKDVEGARIDPTRAYEVHLPSGRRIAVFFYDGPVSRAVAFEQLLSSGDRFAERLMHGYDAARTWDQLVHIATDGETYGHHHRHGEMALAYALRKIESGGFARLVNYGRYLEEHPPQHVVEIVENSSWSCAHGIERWRSDCGCRTGRHPGVGQAWRGPLREALDWLRDRLVPLFELRARDYLRDPWAARDDYFDVVSDRSEPSLSTFLERHAVRRLEGGDRVAALELLEAQRQAMQMYTSCGWFFDDLGGIETVQVIEYAARAIELAQRRFPDAADLEAGFLERLASATSAFPERGDGRRIYEREIRPKRVDLTAAAAHYAISSLFEEYPDRTEIHCWTVERVSSASKEAGRARLVAGQVRVESTVTRESGLLEFAALHLGDHNLTGGVRRHESPQGHRAMLDDVTSAFVRADLPEAIRRIDRHFPDAIYSVRSLFRDEQRRILDLVLEGVRAGVEISFRQLYEQHSPLMRFLVDLGNPLPAAFRSVVATILDVDLRRAIASRPLDLELVDSLLDEARSWRLDLDRAGLGLLLQESLEAKAREFAASPDDLAALRKIAARVDLARRSGLEVHLSQVQNRFYRVARAVYPGVRTRADREGREWTEEFVRLGKLLSIRVD